MSKNSVKRILRDGNAEVPKICRVEKLTPKLDRIRDLYHACKGNLVRVAEELDRDGTPTAYSTLTAFCRRYEIGTKPKERAGRYYFKPGEEMQHDTSPHTPTIGGKIRKVDCASLVMCYSRMIYAQAYTNWRRFECKVFLTEALKYFGGAASRCMLDNSTVIMKGGTGANAVPADEMAAFSDRFGFDFVAHEVGDANRSGRVERPFSYIENNFYAGRTFESIDDLNDQLRTWCDVRNHSFKRQIGAKPFELFAVEKPLLKPLPLYVPEVYDLHTRHVDVEGYVCVHTNRYSAPAKLIGRQVAVRETIDRIRIFDGHQLVAAHVRLESGKQRRVTLPEHQHPRRRNEKHRPRLPEEVTLRAVAPDMSRFIDALYKRHGGHASRYIRRLNRLFLDYPTETLVETIRTALHYTLLDLGRIERMVLRAIAGNFFRLPTPPDDDEEDV